MVKLLIVTSIFVQAAIAALPGQCKTNKDCVVYGNGYSCVSVQTNIPGITLASQCVYGSACGGNNAGKCPTFSSWSGNYQKVQPVCAFTAVANCVTQINETDATTETPTEPPSDPDATSAPTKVNCYAATFSTEAESVTVNGIYKCIDSALYVSQNLGSIANLTATQMIACQGDASTALLCNGHGTCAPTGSLSPTYQCICNQGYSTDNNCLNATSNVCDSFGSCGQGNLCDAASSRCSCNSGTTGPQCTLCDPTSESACNANGKCNTDGTCTCSEGYTGSLCQKISTTGGSGGSGGSGDSSDSGNSESPAHLISIVALALSTLVWAM